MLAGIRLKACCWFRSLKWRVNRKLSESCLYYCLFDILLLSIKKGFLKNIAKFTGKHLCQSQPATLLKKKLWYRCFPMNFRNFLRIPFFREHLRVTASFQGRSIESIECLLYYFHLLLRFDQTSVHEFKLWRRPTIIFIIFWDFLMFYQIFFSPQVKRCAIITYKHSIYDPRVIIVYQHNLPYQLPNDLKLRILEN